MKMDQLDNKQFEYVRKTALTEDFRRLKPDQPHTVTVAPLSKPKPTNGDSCSICLETFYEPRTLPCQHKFCRVCLQYVIDNSAPDPDSDRGFECIQCGHFVKVLNYSIPRSQWADNIPDTKLLFVRQARLQPSTDVDEPKPKPEHDHPSEPVQKKEITDQCRWALDWQISTYPKSYFLDHGLDPRKRTKRGYILQSRTQKTDKNDANSMSKTENVSKDASSDNGEDVLDVLIDTSGDLDDAQVDVRKSSITSAAFYNDMLVVYDEGDLDDAQVDVRKSNIMSAAFYNDMLAVYDAGLCEVQLYNPDMTLKSSFRQTNIFAIAVLEPDLFMTNPEDRCVEIADLATFRKKPPIALTLKCFGISSFDNQLAVLLCDNGDKEVHVSFLNSKSVCGGRITLGKYGGGTELAFPRHFAVCPLTRLAFVSDERIGVVKCYRIDGHLNWERSAFSAGCLTVYNGYVIVARRFTSSLDVLSGGGGFVGRLESAVYGIEAPKVIAMRRDAPEIMVVDKHNMMHVFCIRKEDKVDTNADVRNCSNCNIL